MLICLEKIIINITLDRVQILKWGIIEFPLLKFGLKDIYKHERCSFFLGSEHMIYNSDRFQLS